MSITKDEYLLVHARFAKVLIPSMTTDEMNTSGEEDWISDAQGGMTLSREQLMRCLFEVRASASLLPLVSLCLLTLRPLRAPA